MRIVTNTVSDGEDPDPPITSVEVIMDNGEKFWLYESRPSASQCELIVEARTAVAISPISRSRVIIGRAQ